MSFVFTSLLGIPFFLSKEELTVIKEFNEGINTKAAYLVTETTRFYESWKLCMEFFIIADLPSCPLKKMQMKKPHRP